VGDLYPATSISFGATKYNLSKEYIKAKGAETVHQNLTHNLKWVSREAAVLISAGGQSTIKQEVLDFFMRYLDMQGAVAKTSGAESVRDEELHKLGENIRNLLRKWEVDPSFSETLAEAVGCVWILVMPQG